MTRRNRGSSVGDRPPSRRTLLRAAAVAALGVAGRSSWGVEAEPEPQAAPRFLLQWGRRGKAPGEFDVPIAVAVDANDDVLVTDFRNARVQRFSPDGAFRAALAVGPFPSGLAVGRSGELYVSHFGFEGHPDRVTVHAPDGTLLREWGRSGKADGEFDMPGGIALGGEGGGRVYVADQTNRRVQVFDPKGAFLFSWGRYGVGPGEFGGNTGPKNRTGGPHFLAFNDRGEVFTTEASVGRVQVFTPEGKFLRAWGNNDDKPGGFGGRPKNLPGPIGLCVDRAGRVWVGATSNRVQQFRPDGTYLRGFGVKGTAPGEFNTPHGLALDRRGNLYVVDTLNCRVQKFAV